MALDKLCKQIPTTLLFKVLPFCLLASACLSIPELPEVPENFFNKATEINIESPESRNNDKFFNADYGQYTVSNTKVGSVRTPKETYKVDEGNNNNLIENLLSNDEFEINRYRTYAQSHAQLFSFNIDYDPQNRFRSNCDQTNVLYETKASRSQYSDRDPDWHNSILICEIEYQDRSWKLTVLSFKNKTPILKLESAISDVSSTSESDLPTSVESSEYQLIPLHLYWGGLSDPNRISIHGSFDYTALEQTSLVPYGIAIGRDEEYLSTAKITGDNAQVLVKSNLDNDEKNFLLGVNHTLVMSSWLNKHQY